MEVRIYSNVTVIDTIYNYIFQLFHSYPNKDVIAEEQTVLISINFPNNTRDNVAKNIKFQKILCFIVSKFPNYQIWISNPDENTKVIEIK
jgi:hypothetical protein